MVVFSQYEMDAIWQAGAPSPELSLGTASFQPTWQQVEKLNNIFVSFCTFFLTQMFSYLESPFMVCYNPGSPDQDTESQSGDCEAMQAVVPEPARVELTSTSYPDLTGCDLGYPVSILIEK